MNKRGARLVENALGQKVVCPVINAPKEAAHQIIAVTQLEALGAQSAKSIENHLCLHCNSDECWLQRRKDVPFVCTKEESLIESNHFRSELRVFDSHGVHMQNLVNASIISAGSYGKTFLFLDTYDLKHIIVKTINFEKDYSKHLDKLGLERGLDLELKAYKTLKEKQFPYSPFIRYCSGSRKMIWDEPEVVSMDCSSLWRKNTEKCPGFLMPYFPIDLSNLSTGTINWIEILDCCLRLGDIGFVHCDLKPQHIRYTTVADLASEHSIRRVRFVDFGIARFNHETCFHIPPHVYSAPEGLSDWKRDYFSVLIMFLDKEFPEFKVSNRFGSVHFDKKAQMQAKWDFLLRSESQYSKKWPCELLSCIMLFNLGSNTYLKTLSKEGFYVKLCFSMISLYSYDKGCVERESNASFDDRRAFEKNTFAKSCISFVGLQKLNEARKLFHQRVLDTLIEERCAMGGDAQLETTSDVLKYWKHLCNRYNRKKDVLSPRYVYWYIVLVEIRYKYCKLFMS